MKTENINKILKRKGFENSANNTNNQSKIVYLYIQDNFFEMNTLEMGKELKTKYNQKLINNSKRRVSLFHLKDHYHPNLNKPNDVFNKEKLKSRLFNKNSNNNGSKNETMNGNKYVIIMIF